MFLRRKLALNPPPQKQIPAARRAEAELAKRCPRAAPRVRVDVSRVPCGNLLSKREQKRKRQVPLRHVRV